MLAAAGSGPAEAATDGRAERLERLLQAADRGEWAGARRLADALGSPALGTYLRWRELVEARPGDRPGFAAYAEFLRRERDWPSLGLVQARGEERIDASVGPSERLAFFAGREPRTRQGRAALAEARLAAGDAAGAAALARRSWVADDLAAGEEERFLARFGAFLRGEDHAERLDRLLWDGRLGDARRMLNRVGAGDRAVASARLALQGGEPGVEAALAAVPEARRVEPGLLYDRLRWRQRKGLKEGALAILLDPPARLGRPELWWSERHRAIREALGKRAFGLAYRLAAAHGQERGAAFAEGEWLAGWVALRFLGDPGTAGRHFERLWERVGTPISRARAAYWAGRAAAARGEAGAAEDWYGRAAVHAGAFYGQLAAQELGIEPAARLEPPEAVSASVRAALERRAPAQLGGLFCRLAQPAPAQPFFRHLGHEAAADLEELRAVVELAGTCGRADLALAAVRAAAGNGAYLVREAFPVPRLPGFGQQAEDGPEPALVLALARQESLFDPAARSPAGALGLMQLMPGTAAAVARQQGLRVSRAALLADPGLNLRLGSAYLQRQLVRFGGEPALALAAYNAGPGRVAEWLEAHGDPRGGGRYRLIDWIELIPFSETRNYVQRVLEGRIMYRAILAGAGARPSRTVAAVPPVPRRAPERTAADAAPLPQLKPAS